MQERVLKNTYEPCSNNNKRPIYEEQRLHIEELDEWRTQKLKTPVKPKLSQDNFNTSPNQLKVGDKVLLDVVDPRIATLEPNEEIPLTVLSIFLYGTVKVIHPKFGIFKVNNTRLKPYVDKVDSRDEECKLLVPPLPCRREFRLGGLVRQLSVPEFEIALGLHTEEFIDDNEFDTLHRHIHYSPSKCWKDLVPASATYNPSHSKVSALPPSLRYLHAILAYTLTGRRESISVYRLAQSTEEKDLEDITDDVPPLHEDPPTQPPPPSHPVHAAASYVDISECLTRFEL
ncbi:hypothetical protein GOBAR_AA24760 [Gossypium barbadense]|uniref:Uncharacterized protein n=1 Tax=Gossypium barbadense TaxID=3634 RepID=A0A2P5WXT7_GOSBA|nr:hypothetical protein GOBAR_AA24760 [Gossypium barbadense]